MKTLNLSIASGVLLALAASLLLAQEKKPRVSPHETVNATVDGAKTGLGWLYDNMMVPLQGTMFSILAFFIASAAYRAFRARSREASVLLVSAVLVMMGRVPLGQFLLPWTWDVTQWLLNVVNSAVRRAILIGVSMGQVALSLKIILGIERAYLGGGRDQ